MQGTGYFLVHLMETSTLWTTPYFRAVDLVPDKPMFMLSFQCISVIIIWTAKVIITVDSSLGFRETKIYHSNSTSIMWPFGYMCLSFGIFVRVLSTGFGKNGLPLQIPQLYVVLCRHLLFPFLIFTMSHFWRVFALIELYCASLLCTFFCTISLQILNLFHVYFL